MANIALITNNILSDSGTALTSVLSGSGTTNYLSKFTGSTALGNSIIYDNGTAVGIGTTSPSYKLDVNGSLYWGNPSGEYMYAGGGGHKFAYSNSTGNYLYSGGSSGLTINNAADTINLVRITDAGLVGIGTTNPTARLHTVGTFEVTKIVSTNTTLYTTYNANSVDVGYIGNGSGTINSGGTNDFGLQATNNLLIATGGGTERMRIASGGNVLIGTSTDAGYKLQVNGDAFVNNGNVYVGTAGSSYPSLITNGGPNSTGSYYGWGQGNGSWDSRPNGNSPYIMNWHTGLTFSANSYYGGIRFYNQGYPSMYSSTLVMSVVNDNVGIGTSTPSAKLVVAGASGNTYIAIDNVSSGENYFAANNFQVFQTAGVERMRITSTGNVGIGTTSPAWKLVVSKNGAAGLEIDPDNGTAGKIGVYAYNRSASSYMPLSFESAFYAFGIGNFGIGTTTDAGYKLDVNGDIRTQTGYIRGANSDADIRLDGTVGSQLRYGGQKVLLNSADAYIYTANTARLYINNAGNVGIGTTSPTEKLSVNGNMAFPKSGNTFIYNDQSGADSITIGGASYFSVKTFNGANYIEVFRATSTNNLLIGTTTDAGYKLDVNGTQRVQYGTVERGVIFTHSNGTYAEIVLGNGSAAGVGVVEIHRNGTSAISFRSNAVLFNTSRLVTPSTFFVTGPYGGSNIGTSVRLASNTVDQGVYTATSGTQSTVVIGNSGNEIWQPSSGNATYNLFSILPSINTSGTYAGIVRGFYYSPTLTSVTGVTHRAIETVSGDVIFGSTSGNVGVGTSSPSGKLHVIAAVGNGTKITTSGYSNWGNIASFNNDSAGGLFGLNIQAYSDVGGNRIINIVGNNTTGINFPNSVSVSSWSLYGCYYNTFWQDAVLYLRNTTGGTGGFKFTSVVTGVLMSILENGRVLIGTTTDTGEKLQVNGSGNFNLGNSGYIKLQSGSGQRHGFIQSAYSNFLFSNNIYYDGSNWRYDQNGYGAQIQTETLSTGVIAFNTFASGTGGNVATIIESMRIANSGNILMGDPNDYGFKLQVNGTSIFSDTIIQDYGNNSNASRGITSYIAQSNLTNDYVNGYYSGETISGELASTVSAGQVVAMKANSLQWELADASTAASIGKNMIGIACYDGNSTDVITILLNGFFASNTYYNNSGNYGVPMYLNASTNGSLTDVAPSTTGNIVRIVGHIDNYSNSNGCAVVRFNPDNFWLVI